MAEAELNVVAAFSLAAGGCFNAANIAGFFYCLHFLLSVLRAYIYMYIIGSLFTLVK